MVPWRKRKQVLPKTIHLWRGKHWAQIQRQESRRGDARRLVTNIRRQISQFKKIKTKNRLSPTNISYRTKGILLAFSELADEMQQAEQQVRGQSCEWNDVYVDCIKHFWRELPPEIRREIIRQTKQ